MRMSEERVEGISLAITDRLAEAELIDLTIDEDDVANLIFEVIIADMRMEEEVHREAVQWIETNKKHLEPGSTAWQVELDQRREQIAIRSGYRLP